MDSKDHTLHLLQALHSPHSVARRLSETTRRNVRSPSGTLSPGDFGAAAHSLDDVASASFLSAARQWRMVKASLTSWPTATKKTPPLSSPLSSPSLANAVKSPTMLIWSGTTQRRNMDEGEDGEQYKSERRHKDGSLSVRNVNGAPEPCASLEEIAEAFIRVSELAERQGSHLVHDSSSLYHPALVRHHILGFIAPKCSQIEKYRRNIRHFSSSIEDPESSTQKKKSVEGNPECFRGQQKEDTTPSEEDEGQLEVDGRHSEAALVSALETIHETILSHNWSCSKDEKPDTEKSPRNHGNGDAAIIGGERRQKALSSSLPSMPLLCGLDYYRCGTFAPALVLMFGNLPAICKWWEVSQAVIWAPLQQMSTQCEGAHLPYGTSKDYRSDHFLAGEKLCVLFFVLPLFLWLEEEGQPGIMGKFRSTRHLGIASVSDTKHNDYLAAEIRQSFFESINPITAEAIVDSLGFEWGEKEKDLHPLRSDNRTHRGVDGEEEGDPMRVENRPNSQINRQRIQTLLGFDAFYDALIIAPANSDDAEKDEHITPLSATQAILPPSTTKLFSSSTHLPLHPDEFPRIPLLTMLRLVVFLTSPVGVIHRRQMLQLLPSPQQLQALDRCWCMANLGLVSCGVLGARVYMKLGQDEKAAEALRLTLAYSRKRFVRAQCHTLLAKLRYRSYKMAATAILEAAMASSVAEEPGIPPTDKRTSPSKVQQIKLERSANYATMAEEVESHLTKALGEATSGSLFLLEVVIAVLWQDLLGQMPIDTPENLFDGSTDTEENDAEAAENFSIEAEVLLEAACSKLGRTRNELSPLLEKPMDADQSGGKDSCDDHEDKSDDDEDEGEEHVEVISSTNLKEHLAAPTVVGDTHRLEAIHEENSEP